MSQVLGILSHVHARLWLEVYLVLSPPPPLLL